MHRINSWAKAHASSRGVPTVNNPPPTQGTPIAQPPPAQSAVAPAHNEQVKQPSEKDPEPSLGPGPSAASDSQDGEVEHHSSLDRLKNATARFLRHTKTVICHSWVNVLLVFVPVGIAVEAVGLNPAVIFALNAIAIVPLAGILSHATESVASRLGDAVGALINVTFGNAVELIIFIIALIKNEIRIVQASLLGSILANLLLIMGMAFFVGGLRFQEQIYNSTVTQMSACLLSLSVMSLLLPTAFHASWADNKNADRYTLKVSRGTSVVLLLVYVLYILFQLKSHAYLYASIPQRIIDEESHPGVLADFMNSSSDSSGSSGSDTDDSTTSWSTAKRIRRAMKYRRHRKSSTSSKAASARASFRKKTGDSVNTLGGSAGSSHRDDPASSVVDLGNDIRLDDLNVDPFDGPRTRDFGQELSSVKSHKEERKSKKHSKKTKRRRSERDIPRLSGEDHDDPEAALSSPRRLTLVSYSSEPTLESPEATVVAEPPMPEDDGTATPKKKLNFRPAIRPAIPSILTNTVFSSTQAPVVHPGPATWRAQPGLRRTNSLPSQMNRQAQAVNAVQFARSAARTPHAEDATANEAHADHPDPEMSRTAAVVMLLVSTALVAVCAEFLVGAIPGMIQSSNVSQAFIGLIILPIVGNAAEHVTAVSVASKNKMDLSIGVSVGSSIQIAIFVTPLVVILGWCMGKDMSLYFTLFETISLFVTAFVVNFLVLDGRSNYLEGALLIAAYVIIAVAAFYYPSEQQASSLAS